MLHVHARGACPKAYLAAHAYHKITIVSSGKTECISSLLYRARTARLYSLYFCSYVCMCVCVHVCTRRGARYALARFQNVHFSRTWQFNDIRRRDYSDRRVSPSRRNGSFRESTDRRIQMPLSYPGISAGARAVTLLHNYASIAQLRPRWIDPPRKFHETRSRITSPALSVFVLIENSGWPGCLDLSQPRQTG